jgi:hypothetical protein
MSALTAEGRPPRPIGARPKESLRICLPRFPHNAEPPKRQQLSRVELNPTPQSVVEAIMYSVRARGLTALEEPDSQERLSRCDDAAREQIKRRFAKLREQGVLP